MHLFAIEELEHLEHQRLFNENRNPQNPFEIRNTKFIKTFRVSQDLFRCIVDWLRPWMRPKLRPADLDVETRVLVALNFYASGSYQRSVGLNKYLDVSQSSVSNSVREVTDILNLPEILNQWIKFPDNFDDLNKVRTRFLRFYEDHKFPGVVGCIDCTHVAIVAPGQQDAGHPEHLYVNRKGYHSINVHLVCDSKLRIMNICARYPGSTNDSFIWNGSQLQTLLRTLHGNGHTDYFLLGDLGYPLRSWLLTPLEYDLPPNSPEEFYNIVHKQMRSKIECCNGVLKSRFRCLLKHGVLHYNPEAACKIINACAVLHMCIHYNVPEVKLEQEMDIDFGIFNENMPDDEEAFQSVNIELAEGRRFRHNVIRGINTLRHTL